MNYTLGPDGVVPSALVFCEVPPVFTGSETPKTWPNIEERAEISSKACQEIEKYMAKVRSDGPLLHSITAATNATYGKYD